MSEKEDEETEDMPRKGVLIQNAQGDSDDFLVKRRTFLIRSVKAGLMIFSVGAVSLSLYDAKGPVSPCLRKGEQGKGGDKLVGLPDFSIPGMKGKMSIVRGKDRAKTVQAAFKALGGIEKFIQKGDNVLLKVNAAFATHPRLSATTHPTVISQVAKLCFQAGARSVSVTDNPIHDPQSCFQLTGIAEATESVGAKLIFPKESFFHPITLSGGSLIQNWPLLYEPFQGINKVIGIAPVKHHQRSGASLSLKNWYGLLGGRRNIFHQNIHELIQELALMVKPTLVILDGTTTMMKNGPTGGSQADLKETNIMIVSTDPVAADAFGLTLLEKSIADIPYISKAEAVGAGIANYKSLNPIEVDAM